MNEKDDKYRSTEINCNSTHKRDANTRNSEYLSGKKDSCI